MKERGSESHGHHSSGFSGHLIFLCLLACVTCACLGGVMCAIGEQNVIRFCFHACKGTSIQQREDRYSTQPVRHMHHD